MADMAGMIVCLPSYHHGQNNETSAFGNFANAAAHFIVLHDEVTMAALLTAARMRSRVRAEYMTSTSDKETKQKNTR